MRIFKAAILTLIISTPSFAQHQMKDFKIGISSGLGTQTQDDFLSLIVNPSVGYFPTNRLMVFTESNIYHVFSTEQTSAEVADDSRFTTFDVGVGLAYTIAKSRTCGNFIIGSGLYKRMHVRGVDWFVTPRISYDMGKYSLEVLGDVSVLDFV